VENAQRLLISGKARQLRSMANPGFWRGCAEIDSTKN
jgi:hypothetical protein